MFTIDEVRELARTYIERFDGRVNDTTEQGGCAYAMQDNSRPACIAGQVVFDLLPERFPELLGSRMGPWKNSVSNPFHGDFDTESHKYLWDLQGHADRRVPWPECVQRVEEKLG